jgi:uncharacterized protein (TIGR02757 family)
MTTTRQDLRAFMDRKVDEYNRPSFIANDPVRIPHAFTRQADIEIAGFFAAIFSWGNRTTIINKSRQLMQLMDNAPHQFILQHEEKDLTKLLDFRHRTFNATDLLYFIEFFRHHYTRYDSLEDAFLRTPDHLSGFYHYFFSLDATPPRTYKHIASPEKHSSCKRLNMFLRWMVRNDDRGVDFGIWKRISPSQLICPLDVHVARVARRFGLMTRTQTDWQAALELTGYLITLDADDPVKYDFALFGLGVMEKF